MIRILLKKQMNEIFRNYFYDPKKNKKRSQGAVIGYIIFFVLIMAGLLGGMFTFLSLMLCPALVSAGMGWLYFSIMGMLAIFLGAFGSVFNTYSGLYLAKDNDLLLSMPIPVHTIMTARLLGVYLMGLMYSAVVIVPAVVVYWITVPVTVAVVIGSILFVLLISVFVLTLSCVLGWGVAKISLKLKNRSFITVILSLLFFAAYYFFYFKAEQMINNLISNAAVYGLKIKGAAYPLYLFGRVGEGDWFAILCITIVVSALFALTWFVLSRSFIRIATSPGKTAKVEYKKSAVKQKSVSLALLGKEFSRFVSSPNYMLNCGLGILLLPIGGILILVKGKELAAVLYGIMGAYSQGIPVLVCALICMMASMNDMVAPSVSLEGKSLWLAQSLPITPWQLLRAKLTMQGILSGIPVLFCTICTAFVFSYSPVQLILVLLLPLLYVALSTVFGLFLGLKMPNLTWTNEIVPIKQSAGVMIALFGGWGYAIVLGGGYLLGGWRLGVSLYLVVIVTVTAVLSAVFYVWLRKKGVEILATL